MLVEFQFRCLSGVDSSVQVPLKVRIGYFVSRLILTIVLMMLLYSIVSQVHELVVEIFHVELLAGSADVAILVPVAFDMSVEACHHHVSANVKLPFLVQEGHNVLLDDVSTSTTLPVDLLPPNYPLNLFNIFHHSNACPLIGIFARFHDPSVAFFDLENMLELRVLIVGHSPPFFCFVVGFSGICTYV